MATYHTLVLNVGDIEGQSLAGAIAYVSYDRDVRTADGVLVPPPASEGKAIPVVGTTSVQVLACDDPDLMADSAGFGIRVRVVWTEEPDWRRQTKTYLAQVHAVDAATVNLSDHLATVATSGVQVLQGPRGPQGDTGPVGPEGPAPSDANLAPLLQNTSSASYAAVQAAQKARMAPFQVLATDHGVQAGTSTDQTTAMQAALDAAAAVGADLLLPAGTIHMLGQVTWQTHRHSIIATQATTLDWTASTVTGPVLITNGSHGVNGSGAVVYTAVMRNIYVTGPTGSTTTDFIQWQGKVQDQNSVYGVTLDHVVVTGFRHPETYGDNTWLIHHDDYFAGGWVGDAIHWTGTTQCGENIRYSGGAFAKGNNVVNVDAEGAGIDMYFAGVSFDYNAGQVVQANSGTYVFSDCHIEWGGDGSGSGWTASPNVVELTSDTGSTRTPTVHFSGGEIILQGDYSGTSALNVAVVQTTTTDGQPPILASADGLTIRNLANRHNLLTLEFHHETTVTDRTSGSYPIVSYRGHPGLRAPGFVTARVGDSSSVTVDSGFEGALTAYSAIGTGVGAGWQSSDTTNVTLDTTTKHSGNQSAKVSYAAASTVGVPLEQQITLTPGRTYQCTFWYKTSRARVPPGAGISIPCLSFYQSSGTVWFDEFQISPIS